MHNLVEETSAQAASLDHLRKDIVNLDTSISISAEDEDMLPFIVSEAVHGIDIASHYPAYYRKLLANVDLRQAFVDALEILEGERTNQLLPLPEPGPIAFEAPPPSPQAEQLAPRGWRVSWQMSIAQVQAALSGLAPNPAYRLNDDLLEDLTWPVLRSQAEVEGIAVDILLEATQSIDTPEWIYPMATVALQPGPAKRELPDDNLRAALDWGSYHAETGVDAQGRAVFPPLQWAHILDKSGQMVTAGLSFSLQTQHP